MRVDRGVAGGFFFFRGYVWGRQARPGLRPRCRAAATVCCLPWGLGGLGKALARACGGWPIARAPTVAARGLLLLGACAVYEFITGPFTRGFLGGGRAGGKVDIRYLVTIRHAPRVCALIEYVMERSKLTLRWDRRCASGVAGMLLICLAEGSSHGAVGGFICPAWRWRLVCWGGFTLCAVISWTARAADVLRGVRSIGQSWARLFWLWGG